MKNSKKLPAGTAFLSGTSKRRLLRMHKSEKNGRAATRLLAYAMRKDGMTIRQIAGRMGRSYGTIRGWLVRAVERRLDGLYDIRHGAPCRLDADQLARLRADLIAGPRQCGFKASAWTAPLLVEHVRRRFGVQYTDTGIYDILRRMGFSCRKPRPKHPKSASESEKRAFKKKLRGYIRYYAKKGHTVLAADEASHILGWNIRNGWYPKGRPATTDTSLSRDRFYSYGALWWGGFHCRFYDKNNTDSFIDFLAGLRAEFGKVLLFVDNASYHRSAALRDKLVEWDGDVVIKYIPPYTPELNPVEVQWRGIKKGTANWRHPDTGDMKKSIRVMLDRGEVKEVEMSGWLA